MVHGGVCSRTYSSSATLLDLDWYFLYVRQHAHFGVLVFDPDHMLPTNPATPNVQCTNSLVIRL